MIQFLRLQNFRSYRDDTFEFQPGVNIIVGPNGCGKTNLLEAILVLAVGASYRVSDQELIGFGGEWTRLDARADSHERTIKMQLQYGRTHKSYLFDERPYKIMSLQQTLPAVLFEPNHLQLLHGQPDQRRAYMDSLLERLVPGFKTTIRHYRRVLAQRNALLKSAHRPARDQLFVWNLRMSELGGVIARERQQLIADAQEVFPRLYHEIAGNKKNILLVEYRSKIPADNYESMLLKALEQNFATDVARGFTADGPHRDDFTIMFDGRPAAEVASRGETRTALLALKIFELQLLERQRGQPPILLLDDVFSELDGRRRHALAAFLQSHQTFITTTDADLVLESEMQTSHIIPVMRTT